MKQLYWWLKIKPDCNDRRQSTKENVKTEKNFALDTASQIPSITYTFIFFLQRKSKTLTLWQAASYNLEPGA